MYILGVDDNVQSLLLLEKMLDNIDHGGEHLFFSDPMQALESLDKPVEIVFSETKMPGLDGIQLARKILERYPLCNIIFLTDSREYMSPAFEIHASGYIMKPFTEKQLMDAILHRRYRLPELNDRPVKVQCFGNFEVFVNGEAVRFRRQKSKELFAYLIDRRGALCNMDMIIGNIEPEVGGEKSIKAKMRVYAGDLIMNLMDLGIENVIIKSRGLIGVNTSMVDCDYYRYLDGDPYYISKYTGEYMTQYEFAAETCAFLEMKYMNGKA